MLYFNTEYFINQTAHNTEMAMLAAKIKAGENGAPWVLALLDSQMNRLDYTGTWHPQCEAIRENWVVVEDLRMHQYVADENSVNVDPVVYLETYVHPKLNCFAVIQNVHGTDSLRTLYMPYRLSDTGVFKQLMDEGYFKYVERPEVEKRPTFGMMVKTQYGYGIRYVEVRNPEIDLEGHYGKGFEAISDEMVSCTSDMNKTGLIILHGVPGTGKTSYLRWLSAQAKRRFVYIPTEIVGQLSSTEFASFLMENTGLTFIVEDAESILMSREDGRSNSQVASILNMTDGIQGDIFNSQFICTFNTELENIDTALLRPGRLLVRHQFNALNVEDANNLLTKLGKPADAKAPMTLAKIMNG